MWQKKVGWWVGRGLRLFLNLMVVVIRIKKH